MRTRVVHITAIALVACIAVWHGWRRGIVFVPTNGLKLVAPWATPGENYIARNEGLLDQTVQFVPWTIYAVERLKKGQIPLWNPYTQMGAPFVGNGQSAIFYPSMLLHLSLPPTWSWTISAALRLFVAGLGMWMLARKYGLRGAPRLLPAIVFMLCGFNVVWLNHPQTNVSVMLPWAVLVTELLVERVTLMRIVGGGLVFAIQFLGGHPGTCIHLLVTCGLVWLVRAIMLYGRATATQYLAGRLNRVVRSAAALGGVVAFGFAMAAMQWLPLIEYARHSGASVVRQERLAEQGFIATDPRYLVGIFFPYANGFPDGVMPFEIRKATHLPNTNELAPGWVGTIPLVLGIFAAVALRKRFATVKMWTAIGMVAAAIAINFPLLDNLVRRTPGLAVAQNARMLMTTALALSILAGFGLEELIQRVSGGVDPLRMRRMMARLAWSVTTLAAVMTVGLYATRQMILTRGYSKAEEEYRKTSIHEHTLAEVKSIVPRMHKEMVLISLRLLIPATMLGVGAMILKRKRTQELVAGLFALALVDLLMFAVPFNSGAPKETYFPRNVAAIEKLKTLPAARITGTFRTMMPETATGYGLADLRGYDALGPLRYYRWWEHGNIGKLPKDWYGYLLQIRNPDHPAWSLLNLGYVISAPNQPAPNPQKFQLISQGKDASIYRARQIRPRAWLASTVQKYDSSEQVLDRVAKMDFNPEQVVLVDKQIEDGVNRKLAVEEKEGMLSSSRSGIPDFKVLGFVKQNRPEVVSVVVSQGGGWLVLADTYFPGWTATIVPENGKEQPAAIWPAYGVMRAVKLPETTEAIVVEMRYRPMSWRIGSTIAIVAWAVFAVLALIALMMRGPRLGGG
ncbi:MAG TPA: hypothetical protein VGP94_12325, partial [Tepidisphaeraceae bacterium]|nr:hypothetical protein [Tepidisphaeraceae bacterium]